MATIETTGLHHLRITVTDLRRSREFYTGVLGFRVAMESPGDPADPAVRADPDQLFGGVIFQTNGLLLGLRPVAPGDDHFDPDRVGLDHLSFTVASRDQLEQAVAVLDAAGVPHGQVKELTDAGIAVLSFEDPDGVQLELTAPLRPSVQSAI
jgi:glyoxylase I family protein